MKASKRARENDGLAGRHSRQKPFPPMPANQTYRYLENKADARRIIMESCNSFWWTLLSLPMLIVGIVFGFFPHKVVQIRAKIEQNMLYSWNFSDEDIDKLPIQSALFGKGYSKRLKAQQERPHEFRFLMIWTRIIGFCVLFMTFISIWLLILAIRTGNLIVN
jgi:hypothetical protein